MKIKSIRLDEFVKSEPLSRFMIGKHWTQPRFVALIVFIISFFDEIVLGWALGYWHSQPGIVGVYDINNMPSLIMSFIVEPSLWSFYVWFPLAAFKFFNTLGENKILMREEQQLSEHIQKLVKQRQLRRLILIAVACAALMTIYASYTISRYDPVPWFFAVRWHFFFLGLPRIFASSYVAVYSTLWTLMAVRTLGQIFKGARVKVKPFHEDNAGGLGFIGNFVLSVSRLALILVPFLIAESLFALWLGGGFSGQPNFILEIIILPLLFLFIVVYPIITCGKAMFLAKKDEIKQLNNQIQKDTPLFGQVGEINHEKMSSLLLLIDYRTRLNKEFPTLPINVSIGKQIGFSFFVIIVPMLISMVDLIVTFSQ